MAENKVLTGYDLSRAWFDFCFENPEKINPNHTAIFFFAVEHCNGLGWKKKLGFPTQMCMDEIGIKKHQTYIRYFRDLVEWKFFILLEKSANQYSANIIALSDGMPKKGKALGKAIINHAAKQTESMGQSTWQSTGQSNSSINKPITINHKPINREQDADAETDSKKLTDLEAGQAFEYLYFLGRKDITREDIPNYWQAFIKHKPDFDKESRGRQMQHFRDWLKFQKKQIVNDGNTIKRTDTANPNSGILRTAC